MNINKVIACGNLTRDPESKTAGNSTVTKFSIAVNRQFKGKDGQQQKEVEYLNIEVWGKTAENCAQYLRKGSEAFVEGRIKTDSYEKDGQKKSYTKIVAEVVQFGAKPRGEGGEQAPASGEEQQPQFDNDGAVPF